MLIQIASLCSVKTMKINSSEFGTEGQGWKLVSSNTGEVVPFPNIKFILNSLCLQVLIHSVRLSQRDPYTLPNRSLSIYYWQKCRHIVQSHIFRKVVSYGFSRWNDPSWWLTENQLKRNGLSSAAIGRKLMTLKLSPRIYKLL